MTLKLPPDGQFGNTLRIISPTFSRTMKSRLITILAAICVTVMSTGAYYLPELPQSVPFGARWAAKKLTDGDFTNDHVCEWAIALVNKELPPIPGELGNVNYVLNLTEKHTEGWAALRARSHVRDLMIALANNGYGVPDWTKRHKDDITTEDQLAVIKAFAANGHAAEAKEWMSTIQTDKPKELGLMSEAYAMLGDQAQAQAMVTKALSSNNDPGKYDPSTCVTIGKQLLGAGKTKDAEKFLKKAAGKADKLTVEQALDLATAMEKTSLAKDA